MKNLIKIFVVTLTLFLLTSCEVDKTYSITYIIDGETLNLNPSSFEKDSNLALPEPEAETYHFMGWYLNENFDGDTIVSTEELELKDTVLYGKVKYLYKLNLIYEGSIEGQTWPEYFSADDVIELPTQITRKHYIFYGWYDNEDYSGNPITTIEKNTTKDMTLYAKWALDADSFDQYFKNYENEPIERNLILPNNVDGITFTYRSSHPDILSNFGILRRDYLPATIDFEVTIDDGIDRITKTYQYETAGYKSLDKPIRSSYIYRGYYSLPENFFDSLDLINTAFALANSSGIVGGEGAYFSNINSILPKAKEQGVWVMMSVGPSSAWSSFSETSALREAFANSIVDVINLYGFDGVDIDWETPTNAQTNDYVELMKIVYQKVKENNPNHLVTTAITAGPYQPPRYGLARSGQYIDYINLMAYGMISNDGMYQNALYDSTSYHNPIDGVGKTLPNVSIENTIPLLNGYGIPNEKIIVGLAFYGIQQYKSGNSWINLGSVAYHTILSYIEEGMFFEYYDEQAGVPYAMNSERTLFISYDNRRSILEKGAFVKANNLGGLMYWEHYHDNTGILLQALNDGLKD